MTDGAEPHIKREIRLFLSGTQGAGWRKAQVCIPFVWERNHK